LAVTGKCRIFAPVLHYDYIIMDVKSVIKEKGFSIEKVAQEMGISPITLHQNLARNPTLRTLQKIAKVIGVPVGEFFKDEISISCPHCGKPIKITLE